MTNGRSLDKKIVFPEGVPWVDVLTESAFFKGIRPEELDRIALISQPVSFDRGNPIFAAGQEASSLFLVGQGEVELRFSIDHLNGPVELTLLTVKRGDMFGWSSFAGRLTYALSAHAVTDSELYRIPAERLRKLCRENVELGYLIMNNVATVISSRFVAMQGLVKHIVQGSAR
ncbi:MAG: Crp/Fnr family transcriptional regulator [Fidelibacterota bacterium]